MPDRIVRDELLDSDRYAALSSDTARMLFVHFLLVADDLGNAEATTMFVRRRLLPSGGSEAAVLKLLTELADCDLIRLYEVNGKRLAHIPRFRQRLRSYRRANPRPPAALECFEIAQVLSNLSDNRLSSDGQVTGSRQSLAGEEKGREEKGLEEKGREGVVTDQASPALNCPIQEVVALYHDCMPVNPRVKALSETRKSAIRARWRQASRIDAAPFYGYTTRDAGLAAWQLFFETCAESAFLTGRIRAQPGRAPFMASLDWLMTESNFLKVIENRYADRSPA